MRNFIFLIFVLGSFIFSSCGKDPEDNENDHLESIIIGDTTNPSVIIKDFDPLLFVQGSQIGNETIDKLDIDLNGDNTMDIIFHYYRFYYRDDCDECHPEIVVKNTLEVIDQNVNIVVDTSGQFVQKMNIGEVISSSMNWNQDSILFLMIAGNMQANVGQWDTNEYKYVGFMHHGKTYNQYGWIMVNSNYGLYGINIKRIGITK